MVSLVRQTVNVIKIITRSRFESCDVGWGPWIKLESETHLSSYTGSDFWHLLVTFANSLGPDQDQQNVSPDLDPNRLTLCVLKEFLCPQRNFGRHIVIALSVRPSVPLCVLCISPIFFEVGIPNLVWRCILGWGSVTYHFLVTVTLTFTSDLVFIVITMSVRPSVRPSVPLRVRCISPIFFEVGIPNLMCGCISGWQSVAYHFGVTVTLTSDLVFRIIVSGAYLLYYLR